MSEQPIPKITTDRLVLRPPVGSDFPVYERFLASPRAKGMGGPYGLRDAWGVFCHDVRGGRCSGMAR